MENGEIHKDFYKSPRRTTTTTDRHLGPRSKSDSKILKDYKRSYSKGEISWFKLDAKMFQMWFKRDSNIIFTWLLGLRCFRFRSQKCQPNHGIKSYFIELVQFMYLISSSTKFCTRNLHKLRHFCLLYAKSKPSL